jgi:hypothetical protein
MRVAIYARVSTEDKRPDQRRRQNPENQLAELRSWCKAAGHDIVAEYIDRASGRKIAGRDQFAALFEDASRRKFDLAWITTERNSPDMMLGETVHFESLCLAPIRRNGALIAGLRCVSSHIDLAILANSEVSEAK